MKKPTKQDLFVENIIDLCAEHRKNCKDEHCNVNTIFIAEFLRDKLGISRNKYLDIFRGRRLLKIEVKEILERD